MITNAETLPKINLTGGLLINNWREIKCYPNSKYINHLCPIDATISIKPIQIPSAPIKPRE